MITVWPALIFFKSLKLLLGLSRLNGSEETFLLVTAALANLTFMSPLTSAAMKRVKTAESLVKVVRMSPFTTLFAKDQVGKKYNNTRYVLKVYDETLIYALSKLQEKSKHNMLYPCLRLLQSWQIWLQMPTVGMKFKVSMESGSCCPCLKPKSQTSFMMNSNRETKQKYWLQKGCRKNQQLPYPDCAMTAQFVVTWLGWEELIDWLSCASNQKSATTVMPYSLLVWQSLGASRYVILYLWDATLIAKLFNNHAFLIAITWFDISVYF